MKSGLVIYIFHRDLRLADNRTFEEAVKVARATGRKLLPIFVFTEAQASKKNPYRSMNSLQFMIDSLKDLQEQCDGNLTFLYGKDAPTELEKLLTVEQLGQSHIFETADYTPFATKRQEQMASWSKRHGAEYTLVHDTYLTVPGTVLTGTGKTYQKFTPFYEAAKRQTVERPRSKVKAAFASAKGLTLTDICKRIGFTENSKIHLRGGRSEGLKLLTRIPKNYEEVHDIPAERTTDLSAHHHFGTISIRETYWAAVDQEALKRQLYWRDFYGHICNAFETLYGTSPYDFQREGTSGWSYDKAKFKAWSQGRTGVPIVDAAMNQMLTTGYMHNRARLIVANYLVKDQKIYWRWGERFFAKHLVDYDFAQNFGNWAWVASVLPFSQAPFRSLKAERQAERFDADGIYVAKWLHAP